MGKRKKSFSSLKGLPGWTLVVRKHVENANIDLFGEEKCQEAALSVKEKFPNDFALWEMTVHVIFTLSVNFRQAPQDRIHFYY